MIRPLLAALLIASVSTPAKAQTAGGPPIAYVKRVSNGDEIHLASANGPERLRLYKARSKIQITMLDLRPGGGEVAFLENFTTLKILAFDDFGRSLAGNPREIRRVSSPCTLESPDYHPTNGVLLFVEGCGRNRGVWTVQSGAGQRDAAPVFSSVPVYRARWSRLGDSIYYIGLRDGASSSDPTYLYRRSTTAGTTEELGILNSWTTFDVARTGERLFWSGPNSTFVMVDISGSGATTADAEVRECPRGLRMAFSPGDTQIVYTTVPAKGGHYVMAGPSNCGSPQPLTGKGSWGWIDWRN